MRLASLRLARSFGDVYSRRVQSSNFFLIRLTVLLGLAFVAVSGRAQDLGATVSEPGAFSYQAPRGWSVKETPVSRYKVSVDKLKNHFSAHISVVMQVYPGTLAAYVDVNKRAFAASPAFKNFQIVEEKQFTTTAGGIGVRLVATATVQHLDLQQIFYFFEGTGDNKLVVTASSLVGDSAAYAPIFDASLKTFSPK